jgi:hypothetical protein
MKKNILFLVIIILFYPLTIFSDSINSVNISGVWENKPYRHFNKGMFSWGENVYSTGSVMIDLGAIKPHLSCHGGGSFFISKVEYKNGYVELTGIYSDQPNTIKKILIKIIDKDTISIELVDRNIVWLMNPNDENIFYRVPVDAPYEPLGPEGI